MTQAAGRVREGDSNHSTISSRIPVSNEDEPSVTKHPLNLLIVSSEPFTYAKTGGLADVAGALPLELAKLGHDVILLLPRYRCLSESGRSFRSVCRLHVPTPQGLVDTLIEEDVIPSAKVVARRGSGDLERGLLRPAGAVSR